ncbi:MAG: hypothetical protein KKA16_06585 [Alphaproteobacteria bacterium]|nr:hypothetical protein [Alphaproteobacteria bacterium]MBU2378445.1 hypothetical protein [Alphaproteobacteria bacterium]
MKTITSVAIAALMLAACGQEAAKTDAATASANSASGAVILQAQPDLAGGVEAAPRLVGDSAAITAINADLARIDGAVLANSCEGGGGIERGVSQPMTGPGYVSFWIAEGYYCEGNAHPSNDQTALTYDLATGQRVDWAAAAPGLRLVRGDTTDMPATYEPPFSSSVLTTWYSRKMLASTDTERLADCGDVWTEESMAETSFKLWLDAQESGVTVMPEFAHVVQGCADSVTMTVEEMQANGVSPAIIQAVTAAHGAGNWAPKDEAEPAA